MMTREEKKAYNKAYREKRKQGHESKNEMSSSTNSLVVINESYVADFQAKLNDGLKLGYKSIWSTYRHPKDGKFSVVMEK